MHELINHINFENESANPWPPLQQSYTAGMKHFIYIKFIIIFIHWFAILDVLKSLNLTTTFLLQFCWPLFLLLELSHHYLSDADLPCRAPLVNQDQTTSDHEIVSNPECLYGPQVIDMIIRKPGKITIITHLLQCYYCYWTEFSFLIRCYNLLYQSLIPNCKLTIKILKQHLEIPSDVESFIVNGESSRIRCQRIINLLLVQLDSTRDYKQFISLFNQIPLFNHSETLKNFVFIFLSSYITYQAQ